MTEKTNFEYIVWTMKRGSKDYIGVAENLNDEYNGILNKEGIWHRKIIYLDSPEIVNYNFTSIRHAIQILKRVVPKCKYKTRSY